MQLHQLKPIHKEKKIKRVGRGGKRGTFSGRGTKGQKARAGRKMPPIIREVIKRYPKLRGYKVGRIKPKPAFINVEILEKNFKDSENINPKILIEKKLIRRIKGRVPRVKILGQGKIAKKLFIEGCGFSKKAKELIEKAGGIITLPKEIK